MRDEIHLMMEHQKKKDGRIVPYGKRSHSPNINILGYEIVKRDIDVEDAQIFLDFIDTLNINAYSNKNLDLNDSFEEHINSIKSRFATDRKINGGPVDHESKIRSSIFANRISSSQNLSLDNPKEEIKSSGGVFMIEYHYKKEYPICLKALRRKNNEITGALNKFIPGTEDPPDTLMNPRNLYCKDSIVFPLEELEDVANEIVHSKNLNCKYSNKIRYDRTQILERTSDSPGTKNMLLHKTLKPNSLYKSNFYNKISKDHTYDNFLESSGIVKDKTSDDLKEKEIQNVLKEVKSSNYKPIKAKRRDSEHISKNEEINA